MNILHWTLLFAPWDKISASKSKTSRLGSSTLMTPIWSRRKAHHDLLPPRFICKAVRRGHSETSCMLNSHRPHYSELGEASLGHEWVDKVISYLPIWSENVPPPLFYAAHVFRFSFPAAERCSHKWAVLQFTVRGESFICCPGCLND